MDEDRGVDQRMDCLAGVVNEWTDDGMISAFQGTLCAAEEDGDVSYKTIPSHCMKIPLLIH